MYIKNASVLIENGQTKEERTARRLSLDAAEAALKAVEPSLLVKSKLRLIGRRLIAGSDEIGLNNFERIFVIGGGKAVLAMANAVESILGDEITGGLVNILDSQFMNLNGRKKSNEERRVRLHGATHPLPSKMGQQGAQEMLELIGDPDERTLVICLLSGGGSSMLPLPVEDLELTDKIEVTRNLLRAGAAIGELNTVRKHLSAIKGGRLAQRLYPSTILSLVISDVVANRLDWIASGPLYPDSSTFRDAENILRRYDVWKTLPSRVEKVLIDGVNGRISETPKPGSRYFSRVHNVIIGSNEDACDAAAKHLRRVGCASEILTTSYEGEAKSAGMFMGAIVQRGSALSRRRSYVAGGETTVAVRGDGKGGRNQEFALGASTKIVGNRGVALVSLGTDGLDGSTDAAGAIIDSATVSRAEQRGFSPDDSLARNDSYEFFKSLRDLVMTGPTGTNVNDISIAVII